MSYFHPLDKLNRSCLYNYIVAANNAHQHIFPYNIIENSQTSLAHNSVFIVPNNFKFCTQNLGRIDHNLHTVNDLISARGAYLLNFSHFWQGAYWRGALIREGRLLRNSQKQEFRFFIFVLKLNITLLYLKNTEFSHR